jgi:biotin carboxyl carrier protein
MPGRVRMVVAVPGTRVSRGEVVLILEAMKMEHAIRAPRDGMVARIFFREGDLVEAGAMLAEIA